MRLPVLMSLWFVLPIACTAGSDEAPAAPGDEELHAPGADVDDGDSEGEQAGAGGAHDGEGEDVTGGGEESGEGGGEESGGAGDGHGDDPGDDTPGGTGACAGEVEGCTQDGENWDCTLEHDGRVRRYVLHVPDDVDVRGDVRAPLVLAFHGLHTTANLQRYVSRMDHDADARGYIAAYPEGIGGMTSQSWNAGVCCGEAEEEDVDDVGFARALVERVAGGLCVDRARVYATGLSNGGHMSYRLACEAADVFAAVASVAGIVTSFPCAPSRPVPVLHFHGTDDTIVPYALGIDGITGAEASVARFAEANACDGAPSVTYDEGEVTCRAWSGCADGADVELCTIDGGGHQWPGGNDIPLLGHNTSDIDATAYLSAFFARFSL